MPGVAGRVPSWCDGLCGGETGAVNGDKRMRYDEEEPDGNPDREKVRGNGEEENENEDVDADEQGKLRL